MAGWRRDWREAEFGFITDNYLVVHPSYVLLPPSFFSFLFIYHYKTDIRLGKGQTGTESRGVPM